MVLSPSDLAALSRLIDEALTVKPAERDAWFAALPAADAVHVPRLRVMLSRYEETADLSLPASLPALPPIDGDGLVPGTRIGAYRLLEAIGSGGMGSVWLAERADGAFDRQVAVKLPRLDSALSPELLADRMAREQQLLARLEHPHIARLYDAGVDADGRPYIVMERVIGRNLLAHCRSSGLALRARLALFLQVCDAVTHAHQQLVVHRDIKPSNILVDDGGQVKLLDFGIAKLLDVDGQGAPMSTQGQDALRAHTPRYAAPEQASGGIVGTACDVYSLGVVLQELADDAAPASRARAGARARRGDLDAIVQRATAAQPEDRYLSADRLRDDLRRYLAFMPLIGTVPGARHRAALFLRRNAARLAAGAALALGVAAVGAIAAVQYLEARTAQAESHTAQAFWLETVLELEPAQGQPPGELTALQILDAALAKAQRRFDQQPAVFGQVMTHAGIMYSRYGQGEKARATAEEAVRRLELALPADHAVLQSARGQLAQRLTQAAPPVDAVRVRQLAAEVLGPCRTDGAHCAQARSYAHASLRSVASIAGDSAGAVQQARLSFAEVQSGWPEPSAEWVMSLTYLAVMLRNRGEITEAAEVIGRAEQLAGTVTMRERSARDLRLYAALIDGDIGRLEAARSRYAALRASPSDLAERRLLWRLEAQALFAQGLLPEGLAAIDEALDPAPPGSSPFQVAIARALRARLLAALGRHDDAAAEILRARSALVELGFAQDSVERLRTSRSEAELQLRAGQVDAALRLLQSLRQRELEARPAPTAVEQAQTLDLLGCALRTAGDLGAAAHHHALAEQALQALPESHPLRLRNAIYAALTRRPPLTAADRAAAQRAFDHLRSQLPPRSMWLRALEAGASGEPSPLVL